MSTCDNNNNPNIKAPFKNACEQLKKESVSGAVNCQSLLFLLSESLSTLPSLDRCDHKDPSLMLAEFQANADPDLIMDSWEGCLAVLSTLTRYDTDANRISAYRDRMSGAWDERGVELVIRDDYVDPCETDGSHTPNTQKTPGTTMV